jgi:hypothetical protein
MDNLALLLIKLTTKRINLITFRPKYELTIMDSIEPHMCETFTKQLIWSYVRR